MASARFTPSAPAFLAAAFILAAYPLALIAGDVAAGFNEGVAYVVLCAGLVTAGVAPLGRYRLLLPMGWLAMSLVFDGLTALDVLDRPQDDWVPVSFALIAALPIGLALLAIGGRMRRS